MFSQTKRLKTNLDGMLMDSAGVNGRSVEADSQIANHGTHVDVMAGCVAASVTVALHPLVIMNIAEHYTRTKAQTGRNTPQVLGAILGKRSGRSLELLNSFELQFSSGATRLDIDMVYFQSKEEQFRQVFKDLDFLGWYSAGGGGGSVANEQDTAIHQQLIEINENSLMLKLDPLSKSANLPVSIYESMIDIIDLKPRMLFIEVPYVLVTEEAERIGVDHVARLSSAGHSQVSEVAEHTQVQKSAVMMLQSRIDIIIDYIKSVKAGDIPMNHEILRECLSLCQRIPVLQTPEFREGFYSQCNDVSLTALLANIMKGCNAANELISKFNLTFDRQGTGRRMRGLFF